MNREGKSAVCATQGARIASWQGRPEMKCHGKGGCYINRDAPETVRVDKGEKVRTW